MSIYIALPGKGAIWIERRQYSWSFEIAKEDREWVLWFRRWYVIFTPPGRKVPQLVPLKGYEAT